MRMVELTYGCHEDCRMKDVKWWGKVPIEKFCQLRMLRSHKVSELVSNDDRPQYDKAQIVGIPLVLAMERQQEITLEEVDNAISLYPECLMEFTKYHGVKWTGDTRNAVRWQHDHLKGPESRAGYVCPNGTYRVVE